MKQKRLVTMALLAVFLLVGCGAVPRKPAVPEAQTTRAVIPGMPGIRYRVGIDTDALRRDAIASFWREMDVLGLDPHKDPLPPANFLVISGGGDQGAFGAGLLNGWSDAGDRPDFKLVTGVSTGALIAPFAFLGPVQDPRLRRLYTELSPEDIAKPRSILAAISSDALADNVPLWKLIEREVDQSMLDAIAVEHRKGRILMIATVDLDARQTVLWNMTKIAASGHPGALKLFHSIMIASASIPAAFPPVMIDVEVDGKAYQEMHVDGGTMAQLFMYPPGLSSKAELQHERLQRERRVFIIRNARLDAEWAAVERQTMTIAAHAISSLIQTQGIGDLYKAYALTQRDGIDYNLAFIPTEFHAVHREEFDTTYMRTLYDAAYEIAAKGYPWAKEPPGL
jgi:hypothetical protein